jgi:hypothetical protein
VLQQGSFGWDVSVLQFALTRAGVYRWPVDGFFGPETDGISTGSRRRTRRGRCRRARGAAGLGESSSSNR